LAEQDLVKKKVENHKYIVTHNIKNLGRQIIKGEAMPVETTNTADTANTPQERSYQRIFSLVGFLTGIARSAGLFLFGIFLGLGIVLRDPPPDKKSLAIIEKLNSENESLKLSIKRQEEDAKVPVFSTIKDGVVIGR
jgi:hypothetical protein